MREWGPTNSIGSGRGGYGLVQRIKKFASLDSNTEKASVQNDDEYIEDIYGHYFGPLQDHLAQREAQTMDATKSFLPQIVLNALGSTSAVVMRRCLGCMLYADANGVTQLAESLAKRPRGAEVLSKCLNKFFTPLIDIIQAYRGDVIKFSGDALYIFFEATDDYQLHRCPCGSPACSQKSPQKLASLRACACCLEIHKRLHRFDIGEGGVRLSLRIGVGSGDIALLQVGGVWGRYECVIAGTPMEQIAIAEPLAGSGETVLSPQVWAEVDYTAVEGAPLQNCASGFHRLVGLDTRKHTYPTVKQAALDCGRLDEKRRQIELQHDGQDSNAQGALLRMGEKFIPRAVVNKLRSGNSSAINEMRTVTVIFAQISGVNVSSDEGAQVTQNLMVRMQKACYAQEGNLNKFLVDHEGLLFLFAFGLPPVVHIDDPVRAVTCCWEMVSILKSMGLVGRFGVTTGRVFCGILGSAKRREYTVMGDTVNLAARLMSTARENTVLIDEATFLRSEQDIVCKPCEPISGKSHPIKVFAPVCPEVHGLEVGQLAGVLNQPSWNLERSRMEVKLTESRSMTVNFPWRPASQLLGGSSHMLKLTRWRELWKVNNMLFKEDCDGLLQVGGALLLLGASGIGKQELGEYIVQQSVTAKFVPIFGVMPNRENTQWQAIAELIQSCLRSLFAIHFPGSSKAAKSLEDEAEKLLQKFVKPDVKLRQVLAFLGFEGFEVPSERCPGESQPPDQEVEDGVVQVAVRLVKALAETHSVLVLLRMRRGTDLFDGLGDKASIFWHLVTVLNQVGLQRRQDMYSDKRLKPILVVTIARRLPDATLLKAGTRDSVDACGLSPKPTRISMSSLTEDAAVELICHCLGLSSSDGALPVKRALRDFVMAVSINVPTYIQECMHHLLSESWLKVVGGECQITGSDLHAVNVASWVETAMVGGTFSQLENLPPESQNIMKLATVLEGAFSPLDLAAAHRVLFGCLPGVLAFHDQAKLLKACGALVRQGFLRRVVMSHHTTPADKAPTHLPRWTIANSLVRKVAGSMVLSSWRCLIKRAVLIERALNVQLPQRIGWGPSRNSESFRPSRIGNRLGKRVLLRRTRKGSCIAAGPHKVDTDQVTPMVSGVSVPGKSPFPELQPSTSAKASQEATDMLFTAAVLGNFNVVLDVLSVNPDLDLDVSTDVGGYTPVHFACSSGEVDIVHLLCEFAASVDVLSDKCETPLLVAAQRGHVEVVQYLCETQSALTVSPDVQSMEYWEKALPEILDEVDVPLGLSPSFSGPALAQDVLNERRKQITALIHAALEAKHATPRFDSEGVKSVNLLDGVPEHAISFAPCSSAGSSGGSRSISTLGMSDDQDRGDRQTSAETEALKEKRVRVADDGMDFHIRPRIRAILRGRVVMALGLLALVLALYIPDLWVILGEPSQTGADVILTIVVLFFLTELTLLSIVDSSYPLGFFFFMDCIGTFSMIWDLSYLLGASATEPQSNQKNSEDLTLLRATRTAKIGARAGRLSRLVKVMRFLPGMGMRGKGGNDVAQLHQISNQLTNVLSKRVACLTILLVIIMPLFTLGLYPEVDFSMRVWLESLSRRVAAVQAAEASGSPAELVSREHELDSAVEEFNAFYQGKDYGPYRVCIGAVDARSNCRHLESRFSQPERISFQFDIASDLVEASFDYSAPMQSEADMGVALITLVIILMCGACLLLNYSASELAVRPLEKMLVSIKKSAQAIFSSTAFLKEAEADKADDDDFDDQMDSEVALLERVVRKIATLAELSRQEHPFTEATYADMKSEELGVLAMTTGVAHHTWSSEASDSGAMGEELVQIGKAEVTETMQWQLEEIGVDYDVFNSSKFNTLEINPVKQKQIAAWLLMNNPGSSAFTENDIDMKCLRRFVDLISEEYLPNPYHSFMHALDVTHTTFRCMTFMSAEQIFSMQEQFSLLVAALGHDVGHPGLNTMFLREVQHELTIRYNDHSPLENMHCCKFFEISAKKDVELLRTIPAEQYREVRKLIIEVILHTDICQHPTMVKELELLYEMNSPVFEQTTQGALNEQELEILTTAQHKQLIAKVIVHGADISNPSKLWPVAKAWADAMLEENFAQGDQEKALGIPVQMLNDRSQVNQPMSQIGFIEFIVAPLHASQVKIFPSLREWSAQLDQNLMKWESAWLDSAKPQRIESEQVRARTQKVSDMLANKAVRRRKDQSDRSTMRVRRSSISKY